LSHSIGGNLTNDGTLAAGGSTFTFAGGLPQTIGGSVPTTYNNLVLNNAAGLILESSETIDGTLTLTSGKITIGNNDLILGSSATISGSGSSRYVITNGTGGLFLPVASTTTKTFPIGLGTSYLQLAVQLTGGPDEVFRARVTDGLSTAYNGSDVATGVPVTDRAVLKTWLLDESTPGGNTASVSVGWNSGDEAPGFVRSGCNLARYSGGSWVYGTVSAATGSNPYQQTVTGITSFSPFSVFSNSLSCAHTGTALTAGSTLALDYLASGGSWNSGNIFTAQLSDAFGDFGTPVTIGTATSQVSGTITTTIPAGTVYGDGYKIRVVSDNPAMTGDPCMNDLTINTPDPVTASAIPSSICSGAGSELSVSNIQGIVYWFSGSCGGSLAGSGNNLTVNPTETTTYYARNYNGNWSAGCVTVTVTLIPGAVGGTVKW
jgi:hypothetical protein